MTESLRKNPSSGSARPDRELMTADGKALFAFYTHADAQARAKDQHDYEFKAENPLDGDGRFEKNARGQTGGVIRYAEALIQLDGTVGGEIDYETGTHLYECSTSFQNKLEQLIKLCVVARLRGKKLIGITAEHDEPERFATYERELAQLTFSSTKAQQYLRAFVTDSTPFSDDRPLSDFFSGFQYR